jgi:hypothetical protein
MYLIISIKITKSVKSVLPDCIIKEELMFWGSVSQPF